MDPGGHVSRSVVPFIRASQADRIGRKPLLVITIVGYTVAAGLTALSPGLLWLSSGRRGSWSDGCCP
jgi:MFS family permease